LPDKSGNYNTMAKLTREQVIAKHKAGESLAGKDLSGLDLNEATLIGANLRGADLSKTSLIRANLCKADLRKANLYNAYLLGANLFGSDLSEADLFDADLSDTNLNGVNLHLANLLAARLSDADLNKTNLRGVNLASVNFEGADLSGADLTGANIWNIATADWKIKGIKCEYVYNCKYWDKEEEDKKTRRNFARGEFEELYRSFPKLELIFQENYRDIDHRALLAVLGEIHKKLPQANIKLRKLEQAVNTSATIQAASKEILEQVAELVPKNYQELFNKLNKIEKLLTDRSALEQSQQSMALALRQTTEWFVQNQQRPQAPQTMVVEGNVHQMNIVNGHQEIEYQETNIYHLAASHLQQALNVLDNEEGFAAVLSQGNEELIKGWQKLSPQEQAKIKQKLQTEAGKMLKGEKEGKLKRAWQWLKASEGYDFTKNLLAQVITAAIQSRLGMPPT